MDFKQATIGIATDDGVTVSSHFGRAQFFEVITFAGGAVTARERRAKAGHHTFASGEGEQPHAGGGPQGGGEHQHHGENGHGHHGGPGSRQRHQEMLSAVGDCAAIVVRGMGQGAVEHFRSAEIVPVLTGLHTIDEVIAAVAAGTLESDPRRVHMQRGIE